LLAEITHVLLDLALGPVAARYNYKATQAHSQEQPLSLYDNMSSNLKHSLST
jgi:hypothetical protein